MGSRTLDQLFKRGLSDHQVQPSDEAWSNMEQLLDKKEEKSDGKWYMMVAAIILLIVTTTIMWNMQIPGNKREYLEIDRVVAKQLEVPNITRPNLEVKPIQVDIKPPMVSLRMATNRHSSDVVPSKPDILVIDEISEHNTIKEEETQQSLAANEVKVETPVKEQELSKKRMPVRITYIRTVKDEPLSKPQTQTDSTRLRLKDIDPDQLWADMRDAKDRAISNAFDFTRKSLRNSNNK